MERLKRIKEQLIGCVEYELGKGIQCVNTEELGEAIDMIKDIEEALYYCAKTEMLEEADEDYGEMKKHGMVYSIPHEAGAARMMTPNHPSAPVNPNMPSAVGLPYAVGGARMGTGWGGYDPEQNVETWDGLEGHSGKCRKAYLESKHSHMDQVDHKKKLETYAKELGRDILEMIEESTPEEKQIMQQKLSVLANKLK